MTLAEAEALDRADPLAPFRDRFALPDGVIYLDGNSLGALPKSALARVQKVAAEEWGRDLITSWNVHDWIDLPRRVGDKIAPLIGAAPGTVIAADSTSINIFKLLAAALATGTGPGLILTQAGDFPTDGYVAQGLARLAGHDVLSGDLHELLSRLADENAGRASHEHLPGSPDELMSRSPKAALHELLSRSPEAAPRDLLPRQAHEHVSRPPGAAPHELLSRPPRELMSESVRQLSGPVTDMSGSALDVSRQAVTAEPRRPVVVLVTEVNYRTGARHDMNELVRFAHDAGALVVADLCHSAAALPVDVSVSDTDFAVGCGYKYLNGGPGAPAFAYVAPRHLHGLRQPLSGWMGHAAPFDFAPDYRPAEGIDALRVGTPPVLSMSALDAALDVFEGVDLGAVKAKADALFELFVANLPSEVELLTPRDPSRRGTQVSLRHPEAYAVMQALIARRVIGDFRQPDIMRFGLTPLYLRFADIWRATEILREIIETRAWDRAEFKRRAKVV